MFELIDIDPPEVDRAVMAIGHDFPPAFELPTHSHARAQVLYASEGVVAVHTPHGSWVAPPERAVWIPAGVPHSVRTAGPVRTRSVLIRDGACLTRGGACHVIQVTPLLRQLLVEAMELPAEYAETGRDGLVMELLVAEIDRAAVLPLAVPFPSTPALAAHCHAFLAQPRADATIDAWADALSMNRKRFTRLFRKETGMSFSEWRQQACVLSALPRLAAGEPVTAVALDLGYDGPGNFSTMFKRVVGTSPSRYFD